MDIKITGTVPKHLKTDLFLKACDCYADILFPEYKEEVDVNVIFTTPDAGSAAECCWDDDYIDPREFTIKITRKLQGERLYIATAHEFVHIKQWVRREMRDYVTKPAVKWKSKKYPEPEYNTLEYFFSPWEVDAYGREYGLYWSFLKKYNLKSTDLINKDISNVAGESLQYTGENRGRSGTSWRGSSSSYACS